MFTCAHTVDVGILSRLLRLFYFLYRTVLAQWCANGRLWTPLAPKQAPTGHASEEPVWVSSSRHTRSLRRQREVLDHERHA